MTVKSQLPGKVLLRSPFLSPPCGITSGISPTPAVFYQGTVT